MMKLIGIYSSYLGQTASDKVYQYMLYDGWAGESLVTIFAFYDVCL